MRENLLDAATALSSEYRRRKHTAQGAPALVSPYVCVSRRVLRAVAMRVVGIPVRSHSRSDGFEGPGTLPTGTAKSEVMMAALVRSRAHFAVFDSSTNSPVSLAVFAIDADVTAAFARRFCA